MLSCPLSVKKRREKGEGLFTQREGKSNVRMRRRKRKGKKGVIFFVLPRKGKVKRFSLHRQRERKTRTSSMGEEKREKRGGKKKKDRFIPASSKSGGEKKKERELSLLFEKEGKRVGSKRGTVFHEKKGRGEWFIAPFPSEERKKGRRGDSALSFLDLKKGYPKRRVPVEREKNKKKEGAAATASHRKGEEKGKKKKIFFFSLPVAKRGGRN